MASKLNLFAWLLLLTLAMPPEAEARPIPEFWRYDCTGTELADQLRLVRGKRQFQDMQSLGLRARFTLFQNPQLGFVVANAMYTYADSLQNKAAAVAGPIVMNFSPYGRSYYEMMLETAGSLAWDVSRGFDANRRQLFEDVLMGEDQVGGDAFYLFVPQLVKRGLAPATFSAEAYVIASRRKPVFWSKNYRLLCTARGITGEEFEEARTRADADTPAAAKAPWLAVVPGGRSVLRELLPSVSDEAFAAAATASVAGLAAGALAVKYPQALRALQAFTKRVVAGDTLALAAEATLGKRLAGYASGLLGAVLLFSDIDSAAARSAEAGGPGYFYTRPGLTRLVSGSDLNYDYFTKSDPLLAGFVAEMAERLRAQQP